VQEALLPLHRSRHTYEPGRPVTPWAFAIARHVVLMHRRWTFRRLRFEETLARDRAEPEATRDEVGRPADADALRRALVSVPATATAGDRRRAVRSRLGR
jgi:DNA-directed RNA polymerase specialized sigma24 family protein